VRERHLEGGCRPLPSGPGVSRPPRSAEPTRALRATLACRFQFLYVSQPLSGRGGWRPKARAHYFSTTTALS
jgi:hypothetical protein